MARTQIPQPRTRGGARLAAFTTSPTLLARAQAHGGLHEAAQAGQAAVQSAPGTGNTGASPAAEHQPIRPVVTAHDRPAAVARVRRALAELDIAGVPTPAELYAQIFADGDFTCEHGTPFDVSTTWLERNYLTREPAAARAGQPASVAGAAADEDTARTASERFVIEVNNRRVELTVPLGRSTWWRT